MSAKSPLTDNFVKALSYYISISGKTKKEIADALGVPATTFTSWSNGKHLPDMDNLQSIADYLGAPISQFYNFTALTDEPPDPLLKELTQVYSKLSNEDKLLVRAVAVRMLQLYGEEK